MHTKRSVLAVLVFGGALCCVAAGCGSGVDAAPGGPGSDAQCVSIARDVYVSKLAADDACKLPGPEESGPEVVAPADREARFDPVAKGPHTVGVTTIELSSKGRTIAVEVWYPATGDIIGQPTDLYTYPEDAPPEAIDAVEAACMDIPPLDSGAVRDAAPSEEGPFPLVVFSHGTTSTRVQSVSITSHLATHGFVVAAPDHAGDTLLEFFESGGNQNPLDDNIKALEMATDRVADVTAIIDHMEGSAGAGCFADLVDTTRIGVTGHSFGGFTTLAAANGMLPGLGIEPDPRISAALPIAPGGVSYTRASQLPMLVLAGDLDASTPYDTEARPAYDMAEGPRHIVKLRGAGHLMVSDMCSLKLAEQIDLFGFAPCRVCDTVFAGCPGGVEAAETTLPAMRYFTVSFFVSYLGDDSRANTALSMLDPAGDGRSDHPEAWGIADVE